MFLTYKLASIQNICEEFYQENNIYIVTPLQML